MRGAISTKSKSVGKGANNSSTNESMKRFGLIILAIILGIAAYNIFLWVFNASVYFFWGHVLAAVMTLLFGATASLFLGVKSAGDLPTPFVLLVIFILALCLGHHYLNLKTDCQSEDDKVSVVLAPGEAKSFQVKEGEETPEITVGEDFQIRGENDQYEVIFSDGKKYLVGEDIPKQKGNSSFRVKSLEGSQKIDVIYFH